MFRGGDAAGESSGDEDEPVTIDAEDLQLPADLLDMDECAAALMPSRLSGRPMGS